MYIFGNLKAGFLNACWEFLLIFLRVGLSHDKKARRRLSTLLVQSPGKKVSLVGTFLIFVILVFSIFVRFTQYQLF